MKYTYSLQQKQNKQKLLEDDEANDNEKSTSSDGDKEKDKDTKTKLSSDDYIDKRFDQLTKNMARKQSKKLEDKMMDALVVQIMK